MKIKVINTTKAANSHLIGKIVEAIYLFREDKYFFKFEGKYRRLKRAHAVPVSIIYLGGE